MTEDLLRIVESTTLDAETIASQTAQIHADALRASRYLRTPNFETIHPNDLGLLFAAYDERFFDGQIKRALGTTPLRFGLSKRMTSSGGKTARMVDSSQGRQWYEISASTTILFGCFTPDDHRPIVTSGITCHDRLAALQRIMEHEIVHLIEMLLWRKTSCSHPRFHSITRRFFGHTLNKHSLVTPKERAFVKFGVRPGMKVRFRFEGVEHTGLVNRISRRATVLVEDPRGTPYSDGKRYTKFYVPVQMLETLS